MPNATIFARSDRASNAEVPLYLRLTHKGDRARMSLDLKVKSQHWHSDKKRVRSSHPQSEYLDQYLSDVQAAADGAIAKLKSRGVVPAPGRVKEEVQAELEGGSSDVDFLEFCQEQLEGYRRRGQEGTFLNYRSVIRKFEAFWESERGGTLRPSELSVSLIEDWRTWLYEERERQEHRCEGPERLQDVLSAGAKGGHHSSR